MFFTKPLTYACLLLTLLLSSFAQADDWSLVYEDNFQQPALNDAWEPVKGQWVVRDGVLQLEAQRESILRYKPSLDAPAIRVAYTCWFEQNDTLKFSDASCFIGWPAGKALTYSGFFSVGGDYNLHTRVVAPALPPQVGQDFIMQPGKRYNVVAEAQGPVLTLRIDGRIVSQEIMTTPLSSGHVALYTWQGRVRYDDVRIMTKPKALRPELIITPKSDGPPMSHPSRFTPWKLGDLKTSDRSAVVDRVRVPIHTLSDQATTSPTPLTFGVPLPREQVWRTDQMRVVDGQGNPIDASITPTATWTPAGSLQWVLLDLAQPLRQGHGENAMYLEYGSQVSAPPVANPINITSNDDAITIDTGALQATFSRSRATLIDSIRVDGKELIQPASLSFTDQHGNRFTSDRKLEDYNVEVEFASAMRVVVKATGRYWDEQGQHACRWIARTYLYRGSSTLKLYTTWLVDVDTDTMQWQDVAVRLPFASEQATVSLDDKPFTLPVTSEETLAAQTAIRQAQVKQADNMIAQGRHLDGWIDARGRDARLLVSVRELAGQFPAALGIDREGITFHAFSNAAGHDLGFRREDVKARMGDVAWQRFDKNRGGYLPLDTRYSNGRGLAKTHEITLVFAPPADEPQLAAAALAQQPPLALPDPAWNCSTLAFGPFHPKDLVNFPTLEATFDQKLDEWLEVTSHLQPFYGFYDHGLGVPHHVKKTTAADGEVEYEIDGYRRNYDQGYGNPFVPWLMYLRSMDRRWLNIGINSTMHEMDVRVVHPTDEPGRNLVGSKYWHYGVWSFDGSYCMFQDNWYWNMPLMFYTTGYQRAMDVFGEIATSAHNAIFVDGKYQAFSPGDRTGRTSLFGSMAVYYKATWDPKARRVTEALAPSAIAMQNADGSYAVRDQWLEFMFFHNIVDMPDPLPEVVQAWQRMAEANLRIPERAHRWVEGPRGLWYLYQQTRDPQIGLAAQAAIERLTNPEHFTFIQYNGFDLMWKIPAWMALARIPNIDEAQPIHTVMIPRPHEENLVLAHQQGKATHVELVYLGKLDSDSNELKINDSLKLYEWFVPAQTPSHTITLRATAPSNLSYDLQGALTLPWNADKFPMAVKYTGENPIVSQTPTAETAHSWTFSGVDAKRPAGRFGQSVRLGEGRQVRFDSDQPLVNPARGTIEAFVRFERPVSEGSYGGTLFQVPRTDTGALIMVHMGETWSADVYGQNRDRTRPMVRLTPVIEPGRWHHVALQWDLQEDGKAVSRFFLDGVPCRFADSDNRFYLPNAFNPAEALNYFMLGQANATSFISVDELRISSIQRYPFGHVSQQVFEPPTSPFVMDADTLLLYHADDDQPAMGAQGQTITTQLIRF